jgi:hypothetical protein
MPLEQRAEKRREFHYPCWVGARSPTRPGQIMDISRSGARIAVAEPYSLPDEVTVYLTPTGSVRRTCKVAWRSEDAIGVSFMQSKQHPWLL